MSIDPEYEDYLYEMDILERLEGQNRNLCISCDCPLGIPGGLAGTGMCGPCCTGETETINEMGDEW